MGFKFGFSTLGCPGWSWVKILDEAAQWGYGSIELRFVSDVRDLTLSPEFSATEVKKALAETKRRKIEVSCVDTSVVLTKSDDDNLAKGRQIIEIANALESPFVRIFGGKLPAGKSFADVQNEIAERWFTLAEYAEPRGVKVLLESHDDFTSSQKILPLVRAIQHKAIGTIWDIHHPFRNHKEPVAEFWNNLKDTILHVHVKDSTVKEDGKTHYCLCGDGDIPIHESVNILKNNHWSGTICVEWEKTWHPQIAEPEIAMPQYLKKLKEYALSTC